MNETGFRDWMIAQGHAKSSVQTRITDSRRLELHFGDLDAAFDRDGFAEMLEQLAYTAADRDAGKPNQSGITIDGDTYTSLSTFRSTVALYGKYRTNQPAPVGTSQADRIRQYVLEHHARPARERGDAGFSVRSGDVHKELGLESAMPSVCAALDSDKFAKLADVTMAKREGPANSSTVVFTFRFQDQPALDRAALERYRRQFLARYTDFEPQCFAKTEGRYVNEEREYKNSLIALTRRAIDESIGKDDGSLGNRLLDILQGDAGAESNLLGWRTKQHLVQLRKQYPGVFEGEAGRLARADSIEGGITAFIDGVSPLLMEGQKSKPYAETRSIPTMLAALVHPEKAYAINSEPVFRSAQALTGRPIFESNPLTPSEYRGVLALAKNIYDIMDREWRWSPRDLWDVQGFIWGISRGDEPESVERNDMPLTREAVEQAMDECDHLTVTTFLTRYGFSQHQRYRIAERGRLYPCKAIINVAHGYLPGGDVREIGGTRARGLAEELGFKVTDQKAALDNPPRTTNLILYGPPGTGKTYRAAYEAVKLCIGAAPDDRDDLMEEYSRLLKAGRIEFVTFHQSFSYEEFVEGLRPVQGEGPTGGGFHLRPEPGTFRRIAERAEMSGRSPSSEVAIGEQRVFKMSIGEAANPDDAYLFEEAIEGGYTLLGFGDDIDWTDSKFEDRDAMIEAYKQYEPDEPAPTAAAGKVKCPFAFRNSIAKGDIIIVSKGNSLFRAIGVVTGDYQFVPRSEGRGYAHRRAVRWLWHDRDGVPVEDIYSTKFVQLSLYELRMDELNLPVLQRYVSSSREDVIGEPEQFVLVIDEINRANISKVFGELITLIEPDKRIGADNELRVRLSYSKELFGVPNNLHIVGTMNTADRSIALLDTALRRRFEFRELMPDASLFENGYQDAGINLEKLLTTINERIEYLFDREHQIGHAYFMSCRSRHDVDAVMRTKVIPLLAEYFYEDWTKVALVLGDKEGAGRFIVRTPLPPPAGLEADGGGGHERFRWTVRNVFADDAYVQFA